MYTAQVEKHIQNRFKMFEIAESATSSTSYSLIEDPSDINNQVEFKDKLRIWVKHRRIAGIAVNELLLILISAGFDFLPKDKRTLMSTPVIVPIDTLSNGKMWYFGIRKCLENVLADIRSSINITLDFHSPYQNHLPNNFGLFCLQLEVLWL